MLEEILANYKGTLFIVSHDRDFLDQIVSQILAFEGNGVVERHIGGYSDYLEEKNSAAKGKNEKKNNKKQKNQTRNNENQQEAKEQEGHKDIKTEGDKPKKLSYKYQRELSQIPSKLEKLEREKQEILQELSNPDLYSQEPEKFDKLSRRSANIGKDIQQLEDRWLELEETKEDS